MADTGTDFALYFHGLNLVTLPSEAPVDGKPVVFANARPSQPDSIVSFSEYTGSGQPPTRNMGRTTPMQLIHPGLQLVVRGLPTEDYNVVRTRINGLWETIGNLPPDVVINGSTYTVIESVDVPSLLDRDDDNRFLFVANFHTSKET